MATATKRNPKTSRNGQTPDAEPEVLTLAEAATFLRIDEESVVRLVNEQGLPGRSVGDGWRFLRSGLRAWLITPNFQYGKDAVLDIIGSWKDDPLVEQKLKTTYARRGRPMTEDGE